MPKPIYLLMLICIPFSLQADGDLAAALAADSRPAADKVRDAGRKPVRVIEFLGVKEGMTALDVIAAGGYYTEVLAYAVGKSGTVYAQNPEVVLRFRDGANDKALTERLANNRLPNVIRKDGDLAEVDIPAASVDVAITALNYHDIYNASGRDAAVGFSRAMLALLKPGGVLGVIDHEGSADQDNAALHRMQSHQAIEALEAAGFEIAATSELLRDSGDRLDKMVFAQDIRGRTSRFLIKAVKPVR